MEKHSLIRTIYLYLFAILGLVLLTIGSVRFINMGLKVFIFTKADQDEQLSYKEPPYPMRVPAIEKIDKEEQLTADDKAQLKQLVRDYTAWKEQRVKVDVITARRQRDASLNLALILVGLPLYLYHWSVIKKESRSA